MILRPEWRVEAGLVPYPHAVATMEDRVAAIRAGTAPELVWLVEHPPLYTAGTSAEPYELLSPDRFPVFATGRGGKYTYHGPGQRIAYVMLDLDARGRDLRAYVAALEGWIIAALADLGVAARVIPGKIGVWTDSPAGAAGTSSSAGAAGTSSSAGAAGTSNSAGPAKIAAIGVRVRRWVSYHGLAINVAPDLAHFDGIVPCGLSDPVTSLSALGRPATLADVDAALARHLPALLAKLGQA